MSVDFIDSNVFIYLFDETDAAKRSASEHYDSVIIAAALASGATRLLSEDLRAGQRFGKLQIVNPFA